MAVTVLELNTGISLCIHRKYHSPERVMFVEGFSTNKKWCLVSSVLASGSLGSSPSPSATRGVTLPTSSSATSSYATSSTSAGWLWLSGGLLTVTAWLTSATCSVQFILETGPSYCAFAFEFTLLLVFTRDESIQPSMTVLPDECGQHSFDNHLRGWVLAPACTNSLQTVLVQWRLFDVGTDNLQVYRKIWSVKKGNKYCANTKIIVMSS